MNQVRFTKQNGRIILRGAQASFTDKTLRVSTLDARSPELQSILLHFLFLHVRFSLFAFLHFPSSTCYRPLSLTLIPTSVHNSLSLSISILLSPHFPRFSSTGVENRPVAPPIHQPLLSQHRSEGIRLRVHTVVLAKVHLTKTQHTHTVPPIHNVDCFPLSTSRRAYFSIFHHHSQILIFNVTQTPFSFFIRNFLQEVDLWVCV